MKLEDLYKTRPIHRERLPERFWSKVLVKGPDDCWPWQGSVQKRRKRVPGGYGRFAIGRSPITGTDDSWTAAHRIAYMLTHGEVPDELVVCHSCDNPPCCNPKHLWVGTRIDNNLDRDSKGRQWARGLANEQNPNAKLTPQIVVCIRRRVALGETVKAVASDLGIAYSTAFSAARGITWQGVSQ